MARASASSAFVNAVPRARVAGGDPLSVISASSPSIIGRTMESGGARLA